MKITIESIQGNQDKFNVLLSTAEGKDPFLTIRGCRMADGKKGPFVSWPATKNEKTEKWWNHVFASDAFNAAVLAEVIKNAPPKRAPQDDNDDIPF